MRVSWTSKFTVVDEITEDMRPPAGEALMARSFFDFFFSGNWNKDPEDYWGPEGSYKVIE